MFGNPINVSYFFFLEYLQENSFPKFSSKSDSEFNLKKYKLNHTCIKTEI